MKRILTATPVVAVLFVLAAGMAAAATTVLVWPGDTHGWAFVNDLTGGAGTGQLVAGPASPPLGAGSARLAVDGVERQIVVLPAYQGTRLDQVTRLEYSTYRSAGGPALAISLQLNIDSDVTDAINTWQGRLVFEPYYMGAVATGAWQHWDAKAGRWWATGLPIRNLCPQNAPCTWSQLLAAFPNVGIHPTLGAVLFKAGGPWTGGFDGNVDAFTIGVGGADTTYDFELQSPDSTPPEITGLPEAGCALWPPNGRLVRVATIGASDALSGLAPGSPQVTVASSEPADAQGAGNTQPDYAVDSGPEGVTVWLRAERSGAGDGRVYTLTVVASDLAGNTATAVAQCVVPHDQRR